MLAQPWSVAGWEPVAWPRVANLGRQFSHLATNVLPQQADLAARQGQTIWWLNKSGQDGAIAWDWVEVRNGVVTLVDPMTLISNIDIDPLDDDGERILILNEWVHQIPWHGVVCAAIKLGVR